MNFFIVDLDKVIENTTTICKVTHTDPRCIASCVAVTTAVSEILTVSYNTFGSTNSDSYDASR